MTAELVRSNLGQKGELRVPLRDMYLARARLAAMVRRGEIACAFDARIEGKGDKREWVVNYLRLREPRSKTPWYITAVAAGLSTVGVVAGMAWHARHVILTALGVVALAGVGVVVIMWLLTRERHGHCPGAWHR